MKTAIKICRTIEVLRWMGVSLGVFFALSISDPVLRFQIVSVWSIVSVSGLTGIESLFFAKAASEISGYGSGSAYQRQSGFNNIALAGAALVAWWFDWGVYAFAALATVFLIFFTLSAGNHFYSAFVEKNPKFNSFLRPALTFLLWFAILPFMLAALTAVA